MTTALNQAVGRGEGRTMLKEAGTLTRPAGRRRLRLRRSGRVRVAHALAPVLALARLTRLRRSIRRQDRLGTVTPGRDDSNGRGCGGTRSGPEDRKRRRRLAGGRVFGQAGPRPRPGLRPGLGRRRGREMCRRNAGGLQFRRRAGGKKADGTAVFPGTE